MLGVMYLHVLEILCLPLKISNLCGYHLLQLSDLYIYIHGTLIIAEEVSTVSVYHA